MTYISCMTDRHGNYIINDGKNRMTYIGYSKKEAQAKYRKDFGYVRKHITWF